MFNAGQQQGKNDQQEKQFYGVHGSPFATQKANVYTEEQVGWARGAVFPGVRKKRRGKEEGSVG